MNLPTRMLRWFVLALLWAVGAIEKFFWKRGG